MPKVHQARLLRAVASGDLLVVDVRRHVLARPLPPDFTVPQVAGPEGLALGRAEEPRGAVASKDTIE